MYVCTYVCVQLQSSFHLFFKGNGQPTWMYIIKRVRIDKSASLVYLIHVICTRTNVILHTVYKIVMKHDMAPM